MESLSAALGPTLTVFGAELRSAVRDRTTVIYSLVLPLVLYPALIWGATQFMQYREGSLEKQSTRVVVEGGDRLPDLAARLESDRSFEIVEHPDPDEALRNEEIDIHLLIRDPDEGKTPVLEARLDLSRERANLGEERLRDLVDDYRQSVLGERLSGYGETEESFEIVSLSRENVASADQMGRFILSIVLPVILVIMICVGAIHPAVDVLAGEKERRTIESTLASGAPRFAVLAGKFLLVVAASMCALVLNLAGMVFAVAHLIRMLGDREEVNVAFPWSALPAILITGLLLASFICATMIFLSSFAKSFKEGQSYVVPFYILCLLPAMAASTPGLELNRGLALVPVLNAVLLFREAMTGALRPDHAAMVAVALALCAAAALFVAARVYGEEGVMLGDSSRSLRTLPSIIFKRKG